MSTTSAAPLSSSPSSGSPKVHFLFRVTVWISLFLVASWPVQAFFVPLRRHCGSTTVAPRSTSSTSRLYAGDGVATNYTWHEEAFEIEVSVKVPKQTKAKDIVFKATSRSIDLRLHSTNDDQQEVILLDGNRQTRGRISMDGTYWVISDEEEDATKDENAHRIVTVTIEKFIANPKDDFQVIEYDWKGVYPDDEQEVQWRKYDEPEPLDVREYAASLGVDIDNINMSMVDKTMFSSGLNLTQSSMEQLSKAGLIQSEEVTQQADGKEFTIQEDGTPQAYSPYGTAVHPDEMTTSSSSSSATAPIPFVDTSSPWHQAVPVTNITQQQTANIKQMQRNLTRAAFAADAAMVDEKTAPRSKDKNAAAKDPIDTLTKKRLQEILKSQGLPVSGTKEELKQRLRQQVNALLQGKQS